MQSYEILTDSACDLPAALLQELQVQVLPLLFTLQGREYRNEPDERELATREFYARLRAGEMASTSALNTQAFEAAFTPLLEQGRDVLYLSFSSALSGTYQNSCLVAQELRESYPERRVVCVDTRCASMGQGLLVYLAAQMREQGASLGELTAWLQEKIPQLCHWFTVDDLHFLKRGGRVSATTASVGSVLHIKPVLHVDDEGRLVNVDKVRGRKAAIQALLRRCAASAIDISQQTIMISHGDCQADAETLRDLLNTQLHPARILIHTIGPVIGAHSGPGTLALFFLGSRR